MWSFVNEKKIDWCEILGFLGCLRGCKVNELGFIGGCREDFMIAQLLRSTLAYKIEKINKLLILWSLSLEELASSSSVFCKFLEFKQVLQKSV